VFFCKKATSNSFAQKGGMPNICLPLSCKTNPNIMASSAKPSFARFSFSYIRLAEGGTYGPGAKNSQKTLFISTILLYFAGAFTNS
jgi:hypothetical protein